MKREINENARKVLKAIYDKEDYAVFAYCDKNNFSTIGVNLEYSIDDYIEIIISVDFNAEIMDVQTEVTVIVEGSYAIRNLDGILSKRLDCIIMGRIAERLEKYSKWLIEDFSETENGKIKLKFYIEQ